MLRCDFTQDYCIGFDSEVLYTHLMEQYKCKVSRTGQFCLKFKDSEEHSLTIYNKVMYYLLTKSISKTIGSSVSSIFDNENPYV